VTLVSISRLSQYSLATLARCRLV